MEALVSGQKNFCRSVCVGANQEVSENSSPRAASPVVSRPALAGSISYVSIYWGDRYLEPLQRFFQFRAVVKRWDKFRVDYVANHTSPYDVSILKPFELLGLVTLVTRENVYQDVRVHRRDHGLPMSWPRT